MRKVLFLSLLINAACLGVAVRSVYLRGGIEYLRNRFAGAPADPAGVNTDVVTYTHRQTLFERLAERTGALVFAGDSLTEYGEWNELCPGAVNRGIGGDTSAGLLKRIGTITKLRPRAVFLMIGANDSMNAGLVPKQTVANIREMVAEIRRASPQTPVYLESILPAWNARQNLYAAAVNDDLRLLADGKQVIYVDLYAAFLDRHTLNAQLTSDGDHLNGDGYMLWKELLQPYVTPFIERTPSDCKQ